MQEQTDIFKITYHDKISSDMQFVIDNLSDDIQSFVRFIISCEPILEWHETKGVMVSSDFKKKLRSNCNNEIGQECQLLIDNISTSVNDYITKNINNSNNQMLFNKDKLEITTSNFIQAFPDIKRVYKECLALDIKKADLTFSNNKNFNALCLRLSKTITGVIRNELMGCVSEMLREVNLNLRKLNKPLLFSCLTKNGLVMNTENTNSFFKHSSMHWLMATDRMGNDRVGIATKRCEAAMAYPNLLPFPYAMTKLPQFKVITECIDNGKPYVKAMQTALRLPLSSLKSLVGYGEICSAKPNKVHNTIESMLNFNLPVSSFPKSQQEWDDTLFTGYHSWKDVEIRPDILDKMIKITPIFRKNANGEDVQCGGWNYDLLDGLKELQEWVIEPILQKIKEHDSLVADKLFNNGLSRINYNNDYPTINSGIPNPYLVFLNLIFKDKSPKRITELLTKLHDRIGDFACIEEEFRTGVSSWPALSAPFLSSSGLRIIALTSPSKLILEGRAMHHCVGSYSRDCMEGKSHIISVQKQNYDESWDSVATVEIEVKKNVDNNFVDNLKIVQVRGRWNAHIKQNTHIHNVIKEYYQGIKTGVIPVVTNKIMQKHIVAYQTGLKLNEEQLKNLSPEDKLVQEYKKQEKGFPIFWDILPNSTHKTLWEWMDLSQFHAELRKVLKLESVEQKKQEIFDQPNFK